MRVTREGNKVTSADEWLQISIETDPEGQSTADVLLSWRLTTEAVEHLAAAGAVSAQILVVIEHDEKEVRRHLFPLDWGKNYIAFNYYGANTIHATIVWSDDPGDPSAERLLDKVYDHKSYIETTLRHERPAVVELEKRSEDLMARTMRGNISKDEEAEIYRQIEELDAQRLEHYKDPFELHIKHNLFDYLYDHGASYQLGRVKLTVEVPKEMFGNDDNWPITRFLGGLFFEDDNPPKDACNLRRRAILTGLTFPAWIVLVVVVAWFAYTVKFVLGAVVVGLLHLWGARNINYDTFSWSIDYWPRDAWRNLEPSRWWTKKVWGTNQHGVLEERYGLRHPLLLVINPPVILFLALNAYLLWPAEGSFSLSLSALLTLLAFSIVLGLLVRLSLKRYRLTSPDPEVAIQKKMELQQQLQQRYSVVVSGDAKAPALRLWFREIKAEVCRPFARNS